jgi:hypothetical protein
MAAKTGPLGVRYSKWSIAVTTAVTLVCVGVIEPAVWQLVGALPKTFLIAVVVVGFTALAFAFISDNALRFHTLLKVMSAVSLMSLLVLVGYAVYFYYPVRLRHPYLLLQ